MSIGRLVPQSAATGDIQFADMMTYKATNLENVTSCS
jgi:hypothetical protein